METFIILGSYAVLSLALDNGSSFTLEGTATFLAVYVPLSFALKALEVEYNDQLVRVAMFQLGIKIFNILAVGAS